MSLPLLTEKICSHRGACLTCRNVEGGSAWRETMQSAFQVPAGWQNCPIGIPWNATADDVKASAGKVFAGPSVAVTPSVKPVAAGVGTEVKKLIASWGIKAEGCGGCTTMAATWDSWGIDECERRIDELVTTLQARAADRGWLLGVGAKLAARPLVERAVANAKANRVEPTSH